MLGRTVSGMASVEVEHSSGLRKVIHDSAVERFRARGFTPVAELDGGGDESSTDDGAAPLPGETPVAPAAGDGQETDNDLEV